MNGVRKEEQFSLKDNVENLWSDTVVKIIAKIVMRIIDLL